MIIIPTPVFGLAYQHFEQFTYREGDCIRWSGSVNPSGYPQYRDPNTGQRVLAHRWIYTKLMAPIPFACVLDHVYDRGCRYRDCVRIEHLEAVSHRENGRRSSKAQTHCKHDHEFTEENTYITTNKLGYTERHCRTCQRAAQRRYNARQRAGRSDG